MLKISTKNGRLEPVSGPRPARDRKCSKSVPKVAIWSQFPSPGQPRAENVQNQYRNQPFGATFWAWARHGPKILKINIETSHLELVSEPGPRRRDSEGARAL